MTLSGPEQLEKDDNYFDVTVEAKYTFGEDVEGKVKINATLVSSTRGESLVFFDRTANLVSMHVAIECKRIVNNVAATLHNYAVA